MDSVKVSDKVELVTPARFLFDAGSTPKAWNRKMLNDPHFKVMSYKADASSAFPNTDIKGGVAVTYRDADRDFGAIEVFTHFDELRTIKEKVVKHGIQPLGDIIFAADSYHFTEAMHEDHPEIRYVDDDHGLLSKNHDYDLKTNFWIFLQCQLRRNPSHSLYLSVYIEFVFSKMQTTPRIGFWLDNSNQTPQQTAENILNARKPV